MRTQLRQHQIKQIQLMMMAEGYTNLTGRASGEHRSCHCLYATNKTKTTRIGDKGNTYLDAYALGLITPVTFSFGTFCVLCVV